MKTSLEMFVLILITFVAASICVPQSCDDYCTLLLSGQIGATWNTICNCHPQNQSKGTSPIRKRSMDNNPIYYEPIEVNPFSETSLDHEPFIILNLVGENKTSNNSTSVHHKKYTKKNNSIYAASNDMEGHPLYLDVDIKKSTGYGRSSQNFNDFGNLTEQELKDCIDLHMLIYFRQNGSNVIKQIWNEDNIKKYVHISDANLMMELNNKCDLPSDIIEKSLRQIDTLLKGKEATFNKNDTFNATHTFRDENAISHSNTSIVKIHLETNIIKNNDNILSGTSLVKSYHQAKLEPNLNDSNFMKDMEEEISTDIPTKIYSSNYKSIAKNIDPLVDSKEQNTTNKTTKYNYNKEKLTTEKDLIKKLNNNDYKNNKTLSRSQDVNNNSIAPSDSEKIMKSMKTNDNFRKTDIEKSFDTTTQQITFDINFRSNMNEVVKNSSGMKMVKKNNSVINVNQNSEIDLNAKLNVSQGQEQSLGNLPVSNRRVYNSTELKKTSQFRFGKSTTESVLMENRSFYRDNILSTSLYQEKELTTETAQPTMSMTSDSNTNRTFTPENEVIISSIVVTEYSNNTITTSIDEIEELPINYFLTTNLESTAADVAYGNKNTLCSKHNNERELEEYNVSGNLYFMFKKLLIPMRFVQTSEGRLNLTLDGTSFCENLVKDKKDVGILSILCKFAIGND